MSDRIARRLAGPIAAALALCAGVEAHAQTLPLRYLGQQTLPFGATFGGTTVGGLSGIDYDAPKDRYVAISDDQTNARYYSLTLGITATGFNSVAVNGVTSFKSPTGTTYATGTIDPESIRLSGRGTVYYSSEGFANAGVPAFVREAALDGTYLRDLSIPAYYAPTTTSGIRNNLAFESLTLADGGTTLVTGLENALIQDGPASTGTTGSPSRILSFSTLTSLATAEYVYQDDPVAVPPVGTAFSVNGLVELLSLGGTQYLGVERSYTVGAPGTGYSIKLYGIDTAGATNVLGLPSVTGISYKPVAKSLLLDLGTLGVPLDNIEGVTFGPTLASGERSLVLVADDNFSTTQIQQFLAFAVGSVPEPATWAMMIVGFGAAGLVLRRRRDVPLRA
ncbi:esterase-like activity of phytase family protein [Sphingomonas bacterium]|uniref:esterase-like activity of phytase family protein n=1 Tax=Sphingomonas bacterium TaxID=1895847 RepID=UPI00157536F0|nr:esterase-like activity of phytase family protein [Sphingomonas bacterium]